MLAFTQKSDSGDGGDEKGGGENKVMILETESPVDEAPDEGDEEPSPEGEVEIADGTAEIEGESDQDGAGKDGETGEVTSAAGDEAEDQQQAGGRSYPDQRS